jgi:hypothetical protein
VVEGKETEVVKGNGKDHDDDVKGGDETKSKSFETKTISRFCA